MPFIYFIPEWRRPENRFCGTRSLLPLLADAADETETEINVNKRELAED